ncbi:MULTISPECIES: RDD family protein [unclassified Clavibacter]|uniref:RDD family protein n=1 Tax=unclassified Clavibacter TaxID=2626594 RepID=UPI0022EB9BBE|nr:RDD family protein [Clavibacter sp. CT19]MDA3804174.1 RDD family protein [Clavibacter sp. CT19]
MSDAHDQEHARHDRTAAGAVGPQPGFDIGLLPYHQRPLPPHIAPEWRLAGVGRRAVGVMLDRAVALVVVFVCLLAWILSLRALALQRIDAEGLGSTAARDVFRTYFSGALVAAAISVVAYLLISAWWLGRTGATPGKAMVGIRVQRFSEPGTLGFRRALLRGVVKNGFAFGPVFLEWLPYASVAWDSRRLLRGWHDLAADDIVLVHRSWTSPRRADAPGRRRP